MRHLKWMLIFVLILSISLTGCLKKDAGDVVKDLEKKLDSLTSYKAIGNMSIKIQEQQDYLVEVWYKDPHYYRIALTNNNSKVTQIVLRNDDGVFVIDPSLNKSYRFKSDWPESNGAVYLYYSLANSIIDDLDREYVKEEDYYVFDVKANYQNQTLVKQKIWLDKDLRPSKVVVIDTQDTDLIEMVFTDFQFNYSFDGDAFDMQRNLTGYDLNVLPAMGDVTQSSSFGFIEPTYIPDGVAKNAPKFVENNDGASVVIKYTGTYSYSLMEARPKAITASAPELSETDIVDLGYGIGILTSMDEMKTLTWLYDGVEFTLSGDLPKQEMIKVAESVFGQSGK